MDLDFEHWRFGGGAAATVLHPLVLVAMLLAIVVMLFLPRRVAIAAFLLSTFLIPAGQQFLVGGVHVFVYRVIVLAGCARLLFPRRSVNLLAGGWNSIDLAFLLCVFVHAIAFCLLYQAGAAVANQIGYIWDYIGGYLLLRYLIRNEEDINWAIKWFAVLAVILAVCMVREQLTGQNVFGLLGGVRLQSQIRDGRIRSEAVFQHAILAGTFGASLIPLFLWLWKSGKAKFLAAIGVVASLAMAATSASSTPLSVFAAGVLGLCFWPFRKRMRLVRWALVISLIGLHLVMKAPVWALIERVDVVEGSSSYHRYQLVNQFILHTGDWFLLGTKSNADWGSEMIDTSNAYVEEGTGGGMLSLLLFLAVIAGCFRRLGNARKAAQGHDRLHEWFYWLLGVALFGHITAFFGIYYFDQTRVAWFALLAMISAATTASTARPVRRAAKAGDEALPILGSPLAPEPEVNVQSRFLLTPYRRNSAIR